MYSIEDFPALADDQSIYGIPESIIEQIASMQERFALNQLALRFHHSGIPLEMVEDQIRLFGKTVILVFD